jgi:hypothetical protein
MKILITKTFNFYLDKFRIDKEIIVKEYVKIKNSWTCLKLWTYDDFIICKWYLLWKEKRLITLIEKDNYIIPVIIMKKESKQWWNIRKDNAQYNFKTDFIKVINDLEIGKVIEIIEI